MGCISSKEDADRLAHPAPEQVAGECLVSKSNEPEKPRLPSALTSPAKPNVHFPETPRGVADILFEEGAVHRSCAGSIASVDRGSECFVQPSLTTSLAPYVDHNSGQLASEFSKQLCGFPTCSFTSDSGMMVLSPMEVNAPFRLKKLIGEGGCGKVYLSDWMGKTVAIKVISGYSAIMAGAANESDAQELMILEQDERKERMTQLEAVLMAVIDHPNLVKTYKVMAAHDVSQVPDDMQPAVYHYCIIMEYAAQGSLWAALLTNRLHKPQLEDTMCLPKNVDREAAEKMVQVMVENQAPPPAQQLELIIWDAWACLKIMEEVVSAVKYLHDNNILHGDLKVANVLLANSDKDERGFVCKITDFGFSRILKPEQALKTDSYGTVTHMPPELLREGMLTTATDVYSIGIIMWEVFCAQGVHKDMTDAQVIHKLVNHDLRPTFPPGTPPRYKALAEACWAQEPESRPKMAAILEELREIRAELCPLGALSLHLPILGTPHVPRRRKRQTCSQRSLASSYASLNHSYSSNVSRNNSCSTIGSNQRLHGMKAGASRDNSSCSLSHVNRNSNGRTSMRMRASDSTGAAAMKGLDAASVIAMSMSQVQGGGSQPGTNTTDVSSTRAFSSGKSLVDAQ